MLLVAVGRGPVSAGLGYEENGVRLSHGYVDVDPLCQTAVPTISAVGDLIATPQLAHVGFAEGQLIYNWDAEPDDVAALIHPHPTQSEIIGEAHLALAGKPLHFHA